jgi:hypothetical protein
MRYIDGIDLFMPTGQTTGGIFAKKGLQGPGEAYIL